LTNNNINNTVNDTNNNNQTNNGDNFISTSELNTMILSILSMKYFFGMIWTISIMNKIAGIIFFIALPILFISLSYLDDIIDDIYHDKNYNDIQPSQMMDTHGQHNGNLHHYEMIINNDNITDTTVNIDDNNHHNNSNKVDNLDIKKLKYQIFLQCLTRVLKISLMWPIFLLTPFSFGFAIICELDLGLESHWIMQQFLRYWSGFLSIKVTIGLILMVVFDWCWPNENASQDELQTLCLISLSLISGVVLICLFLGFESMFIVIIRIIIWLMLYIYLQAYNCHKIQNKFAIVTTFHWKKLLSFQWFFTNILQYHSS